MVVYIKMSETLEEQPPRPDVIITPNKNTKQMKVQLTTAGTLHEDTVVYESDFNIIRRYDLYDEEQIDDIEAQLVIQYSKQPKNHLLDLYFYDKGKTKEYRYFITFNTVDNIQNEIDHDKGFSVLKLIFDTNKEFTLKNCPIEIVTWLAEFLFSL